MAASIRRQRPQTRINPAFHQVPMVDRVALTFSSQAHDYAGLHSTALRQRPPERPHSTPSIPWTTISENEAPPNRSFRHQLDRHHFASVEVMVVLGLPEPSTLPRGFAARPASQLPAVLLPNYDLRGHGSPGESPFSQWACGRPVEWTRTPALSLVRAKAKRTRRFR